MLETVEHNLHGYMEEKLAHVIAKKLFLNIFRHLTVWQREGGAFLRKPLLINRAWSAFHCSIGLADALDLKYNAHEIFSS